MATEQKANTVWPRKFVKWTSIVELCGCVYVVVDGSRRSFLYHFSG
jgi:hypothetical protein